MSFDPSTLALYLDVTRLKSFSRAAEAHGITQSAASQRIAQFEKRLGVTLIDRSVRPWSLTPAGQQLAQGAGEIMEQWQTLEQAVCGGQASAMGPTASVQLPPVRVAAIYSAGIDLLSRVGELYESSHPGRSLVIQYDTPAAIREAVAAGQADLGIVSYPTALRSAKDGARRDVRGAGLSGRVLWEEPMAVVCPAGHPLTREQSVHARHLGPHEMLAFDPALPVGRAVADYLASHKVSPRVALRFDNLDTLKSAVMETGRCAILPRRTVRREVEAGGLVAVRLLPLLCRPMGVLHPTKMDAAQKAGVEALLSTLEGELARRFEDAAKRSNDPTAVGYLRPDAASTPLDHPTPLQHPDTAPNPSPALSGTAA